MGASAVARSTIWVFVLLTFAIALAAHPVQPYGDCFAIPRVSSKDSTLVKREPWDYLPRHPAGSAKKTSVGSTKTKARPDYRFVRDTKGLVCVTYLDQRRISVGRFDQHGNFLPDARYVNVWNWHSLPHVRHTNYFGESPVFEFRSGRLIPGATDKDGNFIPKVGGKIIAFKDYRYSKSAPRIWNLPGSFVEIKK